MSIKARVVKVLERLKGWPIVSGVKALSGYATTDRGEPIAFSILTNNYTIPSSSVIDAIDRVVETMLRDGTSKK